MEQIKLSGWRWNCPTDGASSRARMIAGTWPAVGDAFTYHTKKQHTFRHYPPISNANIYIFCSSLPNDCCHETITFGRTRDLVGIYKCHRHWCSWWLIEPKTSTESILVSRSEYSLALYTSSNVADLDDYSDMDSVTALIEVAEWCLLL